MSQLLAFFGRIKHVSLYDGDDDISTVLNQPEDTTNKPSFCFKIYFWHYTVGLALKQILLKYHTKKQSLWGLEMFMSVLNNEASIT